MPALLAMIIPMRRLLGYIATILVLLLVVEFLYFFTKKPEANRAWLPEQSRTAYALDTGNLVTIFNMRDWTYGTSAPATTEWRTVTIDPATIVRTWFLIEPFSDWEAVGHTFLSFELEDGSAYSFSVEARRETHETYSAVRGLLREYELSYQWGTERDFVTRRLLYLDHPLRLYPLELEPAASQALFRSLIAETNALAERPRFYNTLAANCTNVLAKIVNRHYPDTLPLHHSWYLTGYADRYLMDEGLIPSAGAPEETMALYDLTPKKEQVDARATSTPQEFSAYIRTLVERP